MPRRGTWGDSLLVRKKQSMNKNPRRVTRKKEKLPTRCDELVGGTMPTLDSVHTYF
jgi:hypothetical protein